VLEVARGMLPRPAVAMLCLMQPRVLLAASAVRACCWLLGSLVTTMIPRSSLVAGCKDFPIVFIKTMYVTAYPVLCSLESTESKKSPIYSTGTVENKSRVKF